MKIRINAYDEAGVGWTETVDVEANVTDPTPTIWEKIEAMPKVKILTVGGILVSDWSDWLGQEKFMHRTYQMTSGDGTKVSIKCVTIGEQKPEGW